MPGIRTMYKLAFWGAFKTLGRQLKTLVTGKVTAPMAENVTRGGGAVKVVNIGSKTTGPGGITSATRSGAGSEMGPVLQKSRTSGMSQAQNVADEAVKAKIPTSSGNMASSRAAAFGDIPVSRWETVKEILKNPAAQLTAGGLGAGGLMYGIGKWRGRAAEQNKPFYRRMFNY